MKRDAKTMICSSLKRLQDEKLEAALQIIDFLAYITGLTPLDLYKSLCSARLTMDRSTLPNIRPGLSF
ncbi:MAG: hypothetical protein M3Y24_05470 [Acidobacteriota bacterium]|nr:hypothetical protein [Acidobacteriota bacterium]